MEACLRCGKEFESPYPKVVNPEGIEEMACVHWCAKCNKVAMSALFREKSAYFEKGNRPPWQNEG